MIETNGRREDRNRIPSARVLTRLIGIPVLIAMMACQLNAPASALSVADQIPQWERYVQAHPTEIKAKFKLGSLYFFNRQFNEAVDEWRSILFKPSIRLNTKSQVKLARMISIAYFKSGNLGKAWKYIKWAYKKNPKDPKVRKVAIAIKKKIKASQKPKVATKPTVAKPDKKEDKPKVPEKPKGPPPPTEAEAKAAYTKGKDFFDEGRLLLGQDDVQYEASLKKAIDQFKIAARGKYKEARTHYYIGSAYLFLAEDEQMEMAAEALEKSSSLEQDEETYFHLGKVYGLLGKKDKEIEMYEKAVSENPDNAEYHFNLALAYDKSPREDAPRKTFEHAKAAIRLKSEYKRRFQEVLKNSEVARKIAGIVRDIIEKTENDELTDEETERYAKKIQDMLGEKIEPSEFNQGGAGRAKLQEIVDNNPQAQALLKQSGKSLDQVVNSVKKNPKLKRYLNRMKK